jgi:hypothetical protein
MMRAQAAAKALETTKPPAGGGAKFKEYVSHDTVTHEAKRILPAHGVLFQPLIKSFNQNGNRTEITMTGRFTNVDKPDEFLEYEGFGYGVDQSDKGPGIAMSYAKKMVLAQALMLNTKEDIEEHSNEFKPEGKPEAVREAEAITDAAIKRWGDTYRDAIRGASSLKDLERIRKENAEMMKRIPEVTRDYFSDLIAGREGELQ